MPLFVATDQEGGNVQVLQGPGFSRMPTALTQGTWADSTLTANARTWGVQVRRSGVDVNLARHGYRACRLCRLEPAVRPTQREYSHAPAVVADKGSAFLRGMRSADLQ